jgi:hypothetical protein
MGFFSSLFGASQLNADPVQQELADLIIDVAERRKHANDILTFFDRQGWNRSDRGNRLTHALSMTKVWRADLYPTAKEICRQIYVII